jgi:hypothetical protein
MARISLSPPRTLRYRLVEWYSRRLYGDMLDPGKVDEEWRSGRILAMPVIARSPGFSHGRHLLRQIRYCGGNLSGGKLGVWRNG